MRTHLNRSHFSATRTWNNTSTAFFWIICLSFVFAVAMLLTDTEARSRELELASAASALDSEPLIAFVGTYTSGNSKGIYVFRMDIKSGALTPIREVPDVENPSFVALHPSGRFLYAVNEVDRFRGQPSGAVSAFSVSRDNGELTLLNQQPSGGAGPCHLIVDRTGKNVLVANYGGGSVASFPIRQDGSLGEAASFIQHRGSSVDPRRQSSPHAHSINLDAANRFAFVADLGLDKILIYRFDAATGKLSANRPPFASLKPGAGPRHFAFHPNGRYAYVINEMNSTITALAYDSGDGVLETIQTVSTLPVEFAGNNSTAEVQVHPTGKFLYGSNRGHDSIVVFAIDADTGKLTYVENESTRGRTPRNFGLDPSGTYLLAANQNSDTVVVFHVDQRTGALEPTGHSVDVPTPVCVKMMRPPQ